MKLNTVPYILQTLSFINPGQITPAGWLKRQLTLQAEGLSGQLEEIWPDVGANSGWLGGSGENWERGPYYLDGLVPLAYCLQDEKLIKKAQKWIEWMLASQDADGQFGPTQNNDWWPRMVALKVLMQYADATHDPRVVPFMQRYFHYQLQHLPARPLSDWGKARAADNVLSVLWTWKQRPDDEQLPALAKLLLEQGDNWPDFIIHHLPTGPVNYFSHLTHVVNVAMGMKYSAMHDAIHQQRERLAEIHRCFAELDHYHGQPQGMFSGDEWLAGNAPEQGVELCAIVELMFSLENLLRIYGDAQFAERLERIAYNALPAGITADMMAHQYHQQPNQIAVSIAKRNWTYSGDDCNIFGLEPNFGCCTANYHQGWPKLCNSLFMQAGSDDLACMVYGPAEVVSGDWQISLQTDYPFNTDLRLDIRRAPAGEKTLWLRIPQWSENTVFTLNGEEITCDGKGYLPLTRQWQAGDTLSITFERQPRLERRPRNAVGVYYGPLLMVHTPGEIWENIPGGSLSGDWEIRPRNCWDYALDVQPGEGLIVRSISCCPSGDQPFALENAPVTLRASARRMPTWKMMDNSVAPMPNSPAYDAMCCPTLATLVPYGCARLRIAEFPWVDGRQKTAEAH
ncbi:beta-L-arabinofuranosidase domain-containing protein [Superficieibacter sp.]|uniref:beta-L-arabinofuranosidase domain-containing protein n=1 Tax=Superficieibacter sp. TaxID=2303322 RepID=UPI0028AC2FF0|nr:beta-L-arabinofuranosidase domain-containing protein [Superficieibacter sp.]